MTKLSNSQYGRLLYQLIDTAANQSARTKAVSAFAQLIVTRRLKRRLPQIITAFTKEYNRAKGITPATVVSAQPLSAAMLSQIKKQLSAQTDSTIELEHVIAPELLGGVQIKLGDSVFDGSVAGQLAQLRAHVS